MESVRYSEAILGLLCADIIQIYQFLINCIQVVDHSDEEIEQPDKSTNKSSQIASLSTKHDDTDDALAENAVALSSTLLADSASLTKSRGKKGKVKADREKKSKTIKAKNGKQPDHSDASVINNEEKDDYEMIDGLI